MRGDPDPPAGDPDWVGHLRARGAWVTRGDEGIPGVGPDPGPRTPWLLDLKADLAASRRAEGGTSPRDGEGAAEAEAGAVTLREVREPLTLARPPEPGW